MIISNNVVCFLNSCRLIVSHYIHGHLYNSSGTVIFDDYGHCEQNNDKYGSADSNERDRNNLHKFMAKMLEH